MRRVQRGEVGEAVAQVDACHAGLHRAAPAGGPDAGRAARRRGPACSRRPGRRQGSCPARGEAPLRVGAAAPPRGCPSPACTSRMAQGLLQPPRDRSSNYRLYDRTQLARLRMVKVLRDAGYGFSAIRVTLDEIGSGRPESALAAIRAPAPRAERGQRALRPSGRRRSGATSPRRTASRASSPARCSVAAKTANARPKSARSRASSCSGVSDPASGAPPGAVLAELVVVVPSVAVVLPVPYRSAQCRRVPRTTPGSAAMPLSVAPGVVSYKSTACRRNSSE